MPCNHDKTAAFLDYVDRYLDAASYVPAEGKVLIPRMQLYGQATELALKAYLASTVGEWENEHDLVYLATETTGLGLSLTSEQKRQLVNLNKIYYKPDSRNWKFPSRYPSTGHGVWLTPSKERLGELVQSIAMQAKDRLEGR